MNAKKTIGIILMILGAFIAFYGAMSANESMINVGICGIFIGAVLFSFSKEESLANLFLPYHETFKNLARMFDAKKAVYIPPYKNLAEGGVFLALKEDFEIDLARIDSETIFLSGREKEAGIVLKVPGSEILKELEETSFEAVSSVLRAKKLAKSAKFLDGEVIKILVEDVAVKFCSEDCKLIACPICSSLLLSVAKETGELIMVESFKVSDIIEIEAKKIGGVDRWM
ncbi:MAG: hypothetical protein NZ879_00120 [Archaeoglobaceae archaeon]|nr:hypothetical protein [Archaeoglobaceae archaeon]MDW8117376.1 hypothetical protein [Archaeoglobaceae archaeon]